MDAIKKVFDRVKKSLKKMEVVITTIVFSYMGLLTLFIVTYFVGWLWLAWLGMTKLPDLLALIKELTSPATIGVMTFLCGCFVDLDGNGVPDIIDKALGKKEGLRNDK